MIKSLLLIIISLLSMTGSLAMANERQSSAPILIFVSFSMPDASLKQWMRQAELIHAPVVIRGLIHNSFKDTIQKMSDLTKDNQGGVQIDPALFRRFQIQAVPAVVVWKAHDCLSNQSCTEDHDVIYGDVMLDFALQKIADQKDEVSEIADKAVAILHEERHV